METTGDTQIGTGTGLLHLAQTRYGHAAEAEVFARPAPEATQALPFLERAVALDPGSADKVANLATSYGALHRFEEAADDGEDSLVGDVSRDATHQHVVVHAVEELL